GYRLRWPKKNSTHCPGWVDHYKTVSAKVKKIKVRNTESNRRLVNEMRSEGYLATVTSEDDVIIATTRPSAMTSEDA
ncbi:hypothetical protein ACSLV1_30915, partial [Pseudomonas aeruginosa]|uniref:hypothetical protein n=1 Tax=Pseudomonas aeruginosa TaxID=287 RepID=UPI003F19ABC9